MDDIEELNNQAGKFSKSKKPVPLIEMQENIKNLNSMTLDQIKSDLSEFSYLVMAIELETNPLEVGNTASRNGLMDCRINEFKDKDSF